MIENLHLLLAKYDSMEDCKWYSFFVVFCKIKTYKLNHINKHNKIRKCEKF